MADEALVLLYYFRNTNIFCLVISTEITVEIPK